MNLQTQSKSFLPASRAAPNFFTPIQREFDRLFDQLGAGWTSLTDIAVSPSMEMRDTKDGVEITVEVPGMARDDIKIAVDDNILTISGEKKSQSERTEGGYHLSERAYGAFSRSVALPSGVDAEKLTASMKDGVLKLTAPRDAKSKARTIEIKAKD